MLYAPAFCPACGRVLRSDVPLADPPWITPTYRARGGNCPRCRTAGVLPNWVYSFHGVVVACRQEATDSQNTGMTSALQQHLRRHRTVKQRQSFIQDFTGPWRPLKLHFFATPARDRRAQLTFLLWILDDTH